MYQCTSPTTHRPPNHHLPCGGGMWEVCGMYLGTYMCVCMNAYMHVCMKVGMQVGRLARMSVGGYVCLYAGMYVCIPPPGGRYVVCI